MAPWQPEVTAVSLPGGLSRNGGWLRQVGLRPLTGRDEAFLLEAADDLPPARWTTRLLTRCLTSHGAPAPMDEETVRALTVGDREALLLHLWRLTFGERIACTVDCPRPECRETMSLDLAVDTLLTPPYADPQAHHEVTVQHDAGACAVRFRLPTGADQEAAAAVAADSMERAGTLILERCVEQVSGAGKGHPKQLPKPVREQIQGRMATLDPQAELTLNLTCPACGLAFATLFDTGAFLRQEVARHAQYLYREIHLLAYYYHWSESEILGMTPRKRRRYITLLTEALSETEYP